MGGHQHKGTGEDHELHPNYSRNKETAAIAEAAAEAGATKRDNDLGAGPSLGVGRGLPGAGGGHHPGDDDGCGENSYRD